MERLTPRAEIYENSPAQPSGQNQLVLLSFLSEQVPASAISEQLVWSLHTETNASVVLVRLEAQGETDAPVAAFLNGKFQMPSRIVQTEAGFHLLRVTAGREGPSPAGIASLRSQLASHFRYVLIETRAGNSLAPWLGDLLDCADAAYLFVGSGEQEAVELERIIQGVKLCQVPGVTCQVPGIKIIGCLGEQDRVLDLETRAERVAGPMHAFIHECPAGQNAGAGGLQSGASDRISGGTPHPGPLPFRRGEGEPSSASAGSARFKADVRRLARDIGGRSVGLALSSGAAKGFSHIGVIQVLEENGIEVDVIAGSSMGAYVGALWAYGLDGRELERLARELEARWALWSLIDPVFLPRQGFLRGHALKKRLMRSIGTARFGDLPRPLRIVAGNLATLERVVFSSGEVATAVHCSSAVPGLCVPITIGGETYVDGAVVDPLPVDVLKEMGVARIIAVDVIPTPDRIRNRIQIQNELQKPARARNFFRRGPAPEPPPHRLACGNILQIVMRSLHGAQIRIAEASCRLADLVLRPNICEDCWQDCAKPGKFIALGREAAEQRVEEIRALITATEITHEPQPALPSLATIA